MIVHNKGAALTNVTTVSGSATVTPASMTGVTVGQELVATGVPTGAYVTKVNATTVKLSAAATASATVAGSFNNKPKIVADIPIFDFKGAFGADYSSLGLPTPENGIGLAFTYNSDDSNKVRLYCYSAALGGWKYEELS